MAALELSYIFSLLEGEYEGYMAKREILYRYALLFNERAECTNFKLQESTKNEAECQYSCYCGDHEA